ncbi:MAG: hypothetical protein ACK4Y4_12155, partial [Brevundimonas sp.]
PCVLVGRAQGWRARMTLAAAALAGGVHVISTAIVGGLIVMAGLALEERLAGILPWLAAAMMFGFGAYYLLRAFRMRVTAERDEAGNEEPGRAVSDRAAFLGLMALLALSPGEVLLPLYLSGAQHGLHGLLLLTLAFAGGTILGMVILTGAAFMGASLLRLERLARFEGAILGAAMIILGLLVAFGPL